MSKRAVVIGIDEYQDKKLARLHGAVNDAQEIRNQLTEFGGFQIPDNSFLLGEQASSEAVRNAVSELLYCTDKLSLALFYFSGHGFCDSYGDGYIATYDVQCARPWVQGLRMRELRDLLLKSPNKTAGVVILDCCYSGIAAEGERAGDKSADLDEQFSESKEKLAGEGRIIITSSGKDQTSRERSNCMHAITGEEAHHHGILTYYLLEGLDGAACQDAAKGAVSLQSLYEYAQGKMDRNAGPRFYGSSLQNANSITILDTSRLFNQKQPLADIRTALESGEEGPIDMHEMAFKIVEVLRVAPKLQEALDLKKLLSERIDHQRVEMSKFLDNNLLDFREQKTNRRFLDDLTRYVWTYDFDELCKKSKEDPTLMHLHYLHGAVCGDTPKEVYKKSLNARGPKESGTPVAVRAPLVQGNLKSGPAT